MLVANLAWSLSLLWATTSALVILPRDHNSTNSSTPSTACELGSGKVSSRSLFDISVAEPEDATLVARAPHRSPLKSPADFGGSYTRFLEYLQSAEGDNDIDITPTNSQLETWKVGSRRNQIPVGATALFYRFGKRPQIWKMRGMSGCTASIIASKEGMWASHLWESTRVAINGGSAFLKRVRPGDGQGSTVERTASEFDAVAVDILDQRTPTAERQNREMWTSLKDLEGSRFQDPFKYSDECDGFIFTKAYSKSRPNNLRYASKISTLKSEYQRLLPGIDMRPEVPYIGDRSQYSRDFPPQLMGVLGMQYSPCDSKDSTGHCIARFEAWAEYSRAPVLVKEWKAIKGLQY